MLRRAAVRLLVMSALTTAAACTFDRQVIAVPPSEVVVHGVLDPGDTLVDVLVERSLSGAITVPKVRFDPLDPINTGGGVPAKSAQVSITGPDGTTTGLEIPYPGKASTYGAGRYVFRRMLVRQGGKYTLSIRTADGIVVTGSTVVPVLGSPSTSVPGLTTFRRDRDTLSLNWLRSSTARTYGVRIESPFGAFQLFSDSTKLTLAGNLRNIFASELPRVFIPGFQQAITIYAADTNFFDYYRSRNDPFTGSGIINRLDGGIGLFGSTVMITTRTADVTQATTDTTFEGFYRLVKGSLPVRTLIDVIRVYVETPATTPLGASLSGRYTTGSAGAGIVGTRDGDRIELEFLVNQTAGQDRGTFVGKQSADSLMGTFKPVNGTAEQVVFRKTLTP